MESEVLSTNQDACLQSKKDLLDDQCDRKQTFMAPSY